MSFGKHRHEFRRFFDDAWILDQQVDETAAIDVSLQWFLLLWNKQIEKLRALALRRVFLDDLPVQKRDLEMVSQRVVQRGLARFPARHLFISVEPQGLQNLGNQIEVVTRNHAASISHLVTKPCSFNRKRQMKRRLGGFVMSQVSFVDQWS